MAPTMDPAPYFQRNYGNTGRTSDVGVKTAVGHRDWAWVVEGLMAMGWPLQGGGDLSVFDGIQCFQEMYGLEGRAGRLAVDRFPGEFTRNALRNSLEAGGFVFPNFTAMEIRDWRTGWPRGRFELLEPCQTLRTNKGRAFSSASWYRMRSSNAAVGGSSGSRHQYAEATDPRFTFGATLREAVELQAFSGIGVVGTTREPRWDSVMVHCDVGGLCEKGSNRNSRARGVQDPMVWPYDPRTGRYLPGRYLSDWGL